MRECFMQFKMTEMTIVIKFAKSRRNEDTPILDDDIMPSLMRTRNINHNDYKISFREAAIFFHGRIRRSSLN